MEEKLSAFGKLLQQRGLSALIVPSEDAHQTEFVAKKDERRAFVSGFTGSAGIALILLDPSSKIGVRGELWTDGRYFLQAESELESKFWTLQKAGLPGVPTLTERLGKLMKSGSKVGIDFRFITFSVFKSWSSKLSKNKNIQLVNALGVVDEVFKPNIPSNCDIFEYNIQYSGKKTSEKLIQVREMLNYNLPKASNKIYALVLSELSEIAWLFNLRGFNHVDFCPIFFSFCIITNDKAFLFSDYIPKTSEKSIEFMKYEDFEETLAQIVNNEQHKICFLPESTTSQHVFDICVNNGAKVIGKDVDVVTNLKARKNEVEMECMREGHVEDSIAMCRYLQWLEEDLVKEKKIFNEVDVAAKLDAFRAEIKSFQQLSFPTISSYGSNAAIIHYDAAIDSPLLKNVDLDLNTLYLVDSGGQYSNGCTTDITRTVHISPYVEPTDEMKKYFTLVLDGHCQFALQIFDPKTSLRYFDQLARKSLKEHGADYMHGTSHGVGSFLNVHEELAEDYGLEPGMCLSNEPGYYKDGDFGIRIESVVGVVFAPGNGEKFCFETFNLVPIQTKMIDLKYLQESSRKWLNEYHARCFAKLSPLLKEKKLDRVLDWLQNQTKPI